MARPLAALILVSLSVGGCTATEVIESPIEIVRDEYAGMACTASDAGATAVMDTYVLQAFARPSNGICCYGREPSCAERRRACLCGATVPATVSALGPALVGARLADLEPQAEYCLRVVALATGHARTGQASPCACNDAWLEAATLSAVGRLCGTGTATGATARPARVDIVCRDDVHKTTRTAAFELCIAP